jgi:hypothetical protein
MLPEMAVEIRTVVISAGKESFGDIEITVRQHFACLVDPDLNQELGKGFIRP